MKKKALYVECYMNVERRAESEKWAVIVQAFQWPLFVGDRRYGREKHERM